MCNINNKEEVLTVYVDKVIELKPNAMLVKRPDLILEWDFEKNNELGLDVYEVTRGSNDKPFWKCKKCSGIWDSAISGRVSKNYGCPYCSGNKILIGFNDMWTTNPELARQLLNPDDGYKYSQSSGIKVSWKCEKCDNVILNKRISTVLWYGVACSKCSDGISYPEKIMESILLQFDIEYIKQYNPNWSEKKRYDFYLPKYSSIIEVNGEQHYPGGSSFLSLGGNSSQKEMENDIYKKNLALENNIKQYIIVNAKRSEFSFIKKSISENKSLNEVLEVSKISWKEVEEFSKNSLVIQVGKYRNQGFRTKEIMNILNISKSTVIDYSKRANCLGICDYNTDVEKRNTSNRNIQCVQLDKDMQIINIFNSISEAEGSTRINAQNIGKVCMGKNKTAGEFKWMYKEEYDKMIKDK